MPSRALRQEGEEVEPREEPRQAPDNPLQIKLSPEAEKELLEIIREDYDASITARARKDFGISSKGERLDFDHWLKQLTDLYNARREPKTDPWQFASNRSLRIAMAILDTLHARLLPTIINENLLRWKPGEKNDKPKVERVGKLMHWWIWVHVRLQTFFDIWVKQNVGYGDALTETNWDVEVVDQGQTIRQPVTDEFGNPLQEENGQPAVAQFRNIKLIEKTCSRTYQKPQVFLQEGSRDIHKEPVIIEEDMLYRDLEQGELEGKFVNVTNQLREKIPFRVNENANFAPGELERLKNIRLRNHKIKTQKWYGNFDADGDGFAEDVRVVVSLGHRVYLGGIQVKNLTMSGKRPIHFQKYDNRLDRPEENDGEGILEKVKELAEEIDAIFNQLTDANTLSIMRPAFYDPSGDLDAPVLKLAPNRMTPVSDPSRNVFFPDITVNIQQLLLSIRLVLEFIERVTAASAFVLGKESEVVGGSGTATRTNAIVQAAETRFARPAERLRAGAAEIIKQHLDLLQLNIPPGLESRILGEKGEQIFEEDELSPEGISGQFDVYLLPDPSLGSKQIERDLAGMFYTLLTQNLLVASDPIKLYNVTANLIKAWDKDPQEFLGPAPLMDDVDDPEDENTLMVQGDFSRVRAQIQENHLLHIQTHMQVLQSPSLATLNPAKLQLLQGFVQQHIQEHMQQMQLVFALSQKVAGGGGGNPGGEGGKGKTSKGPEDKQGVENTSGPLAEALGAQGEGEVGTTA